MRRRSTPGQWLLWLALAGLGAAAGLGLMASSALPRLTAFTPAAGAGDRSTRTPIRLTFDHPMQTESVEAALRFEPARTGRYQWDAGAAELTFIPDQPWEPQSTVTVTLAGARSQWGLPLWGEAQWSFQVGSARVVYLAGGAPNLAVISTAADAQPAFITAEPNGVADFTVRPDGGLIVYAARRADGGADLRAYDPAGGGSRDVFACPAAACLAPAFAPDGGQVAYERQTALPGEGAGFGDARIHLLNLATGEDRAVGDPAHQARAPRWSPDGRLSFYDTVREAVVVLDPASGAVTYIPSTSGEPGTFAPDGRTYVFAEINLLTDTITLTNTLAVTGNVPTEVTGYYSHLLRVSVATNAAQDLSGAGAGVVEDAAPVYSVSGEWLAFGRKQLAGAEWQPGRQVWLMRPDGTDAHPLTNAADYHHSAFRWSPDDRQLVYMRADAVDPNQPAEIWLSNAEGSEARRLVTGGYLPEWLP